ncbi:MULTISPECIES: Zn-ribbon domain-containing OB-fold protein [Actinomadura]|uniref:Nucleotide-binding protein n=1 Tax=Actinomadura litoris TaxID=2678616 RepID=A0A7K1KSL5_9ACTN|nr:MULTISPECIES: Zn-ribbon domain-containing OB-fold protein [Actinomadura]MBT2208024.1 Zn-ribbon domain-containing OB-fold protein [Actinomadura sp. NEAU-AAG7]MUN35133.1 nucleotide-binding protein [Actinomadura litoris]
MSEVRSPVLPAARPVVNPDTEEFWKATAEGRFIGRRCDDCGSAMWYPRPICPFCHSSNTRWEDFTGRGTVYSFSVVHRAGGEWKGVTPYVLAYVELEEGPRMMTNIVDCDVESVAIGDEVEVVFEDTGHGSALPRFRPVRAEAGSQA